MKIRTHDVNQLIARFGGSMWEENGDYPAEDWAYEVGNNVTRLGYWEWVTHKMEMGDVRTDDVQTLIDRCGGNVWDVDPLVRLTDWQAEVRSDNTRLGYWEYALVKRPRPWVIVNSNTEDPTERYWTGSMEPNYFWTDRHSALMLSDDEMKDIDESQAHPALTDAGQWLNVSLQDLLDSKSPLDAMTERLQAFVMRHGLPSHSADELLLEPDLTTVQRLFLEQFVEQWDQALELENDDQRPASAGPAIRDDSATETVHLHLRVDYDLNGEHVTDMTSQLRSTIEREIGNGALTGESSAEVDEYSLALIDSPTELESLVVNRLIKSGYDPLIAAAVARFGMMSPSDFIASIAGSVDKLRQENNI